MAGDWIKWQKGLTRKPEVIQIAARLGLSRHAVAGLLMEVWEWADDNVQIEESPSGSCPVSVRDVSESAPGFVRLGDSPAALFDATFAVSGLADAMAAVGWMIVRSGSLVFPKFGRHNGKSAKARALDASRKRAERQNGTTSRPESVPNPSGSQPDKKRTREEKRREEKKKEENEEAAVPPVAGNAPSEQPPASESSKREPTKKEQPENVPIPASLDTPEFREIWAKWIAYRKKKSGKSFTEYAAELNLANLKKYSPEIAIEALKQAIAGGWSSLWPDRVQAKHDAKPPPQGGYRSKVERDIDYIADQFSSLHTPGDDT